MIVIWYFLCGILGLALLAGVGIAIGLFIEYWFLYFVFGMFVIMVIMCIFTLGYFVYNLIYENFIRQKIKINSERIIDATCYLIGIGLGVVVPVAIGMKILA